MLLKLVRYGLTGGVAAIVDLGGFYMLLRLHVPIPMAISAMLSWLAAAITNYNLTSRFVFNQTTSAGRGMFFVLVAALGLAVNVSITLFCASMFGMNPTLSKAIGIAVAFFFNFLLNVLIVFR